MDVGRVWHLLLLPAAAAAEPAAAAEAQPPLNSRRRAAAPASGLVALGKGIILLGGVNELRAPVLRRRRAEGYGKQSGGTDGWTDLILWLLLRLRCFAFHGNTLLKRDQQIQAINGRLGRRSSVSRYFIGYDRTPPVPLVALLAATRTEVQKDDHIGIERRRCNLFLILWYPMASASPNFRAHLKGITSTNDDPDKCALCHGCIRYYQFGLEGIHPCCGKRTCSDCPIQVARRSVKACSCCGVVKNPNAKSLIARLKKQAKMGTVWAQNVLGLYLCDTESSGNGLVWLE